MCIETPTASILTVGPVPQPSDNDGGLTTADGEPIALTSVDTAADAVAALRLTPADLLVAAVDLPDQNVWTFIGRLRAAWPWQKWALLGRRGVLTPHDEATARTLGALCVAEGPASWPRLADLAAHVFRRQQQTAVRPDTPSHRAIFRRPERIPSRPL